MVPKENMITCFTTIDDRIELLPHFVKHYRSIGVDHVIASVRRGPNNPIWTKVLAFASETPISVVHGSDAVFQDGSTDNEHRNQLRAGIEGWHIIADLDEFHWFGGKKLPEIIRILESTGASGAYLIIVDRVSEDGSFPEITTGELDALFPKSCNLTAAIGANVCKAGLMKSGFITGTAAHYTPSRMLVNGFECHHFKWSAGVIERTRRRLALWSGLPDSNWFKHEPKRLLQFLDHPENPGKISPMDELTFTDAIKLGI